MVRSRRKCRTHKGWSSTLPAPFLLSFPSLNQSATLRHITLDYSLPFFFTRTLFLFPLSHSLTNHTNGSYNKIPSPPIIFLLRPPTPPPHLPNRHHHRRWRPQRSRAFLAHRHLRTRESTLPPPAGGQSPPLELRSAAKLRHPRRTNGTRSRAGVSPESLRLVVLGDDSVVTETSGSVFGAPGAIRTF